MEQLEPHVSLTVDVRPAFNSSGNCWCSKLGSLKFVYFVMSVYMDLDVNNPSLNTRARYGVDGDQLPPNLEERSLQPLTAQEDLLLIRSSIINEAYRLAGNENTELMLLIHEADNSIFKFATLKFQHTLQKVEQDSLFLNCFEHKPRKSQLRPKKTGEKKSIIAQVTLLFLSYILVMSFILVRDVGYKVGLLNFFCGVTPIIIVEIWKDIVHERLEKMQMTHSNSSIKLNEVQYKLHIIKNTDLAENPFSSNQGVQESHSKNSKDEKGTDNSDTKYLIKDAAERFEAVFDGQLLLVVEESGFAFNCVTSKLEPLYGEYILASRAKFSNQARTGGSTAMFAHETKDYFVLFFCFAPILVIFYSLAYHWKPLFVNKDDAYRLRFSDILTERTFMVPCVAYVLAAFYCMIMFIYMWLISIGRKRTEDEKTEIIKV